MATIPTPTPTQPKSHSSARKLPIKRNPNPSPSPKPHPHPLAATTFSDDDDDDSSNASAGDGSAPTPPFKFHRIWSEPDEIRFLQGLLGCFSQGMVFPRDLNLFYDRFSESMPQPYTRSQLSEKLRRLRKKFRIMSGRIARGQDPSRLAPHDRDLLHLCTRLWHPSYAASSPFAAAGAGNSGSVKNKRRRPNPRGPTGRSAQSNEPYAQPAEPEPFLLLPHTNVQAEIVAPVDSETLADDVKVEGVEEKGAENGSPGDVRQEEMPEGGGGGTAAGMDDTGALVLKSILNVFEGCVKEAQGTLASEGMSELGDSSGNGQGDGRLGLERRWREQRIAEMDVLARRMRLVVENAAQQ